jgi:hypothetical protein
MGHLLSVTLGSPWTRLWPLVARVVAGSGETSQRTPLSQGEASVECAPAGGLAVRTAGRRRIIGEQFVRMYKEHDVLAQVLDSAREDDLGEKAKGLPELPQRGSLDITQVLDAEYAFA